MSTALPSHIAMKHSYKHSDDLNIPHAPTLRTKLEAALWVAENGMKQTDFPNIVARCELRAANIRTKLALLDRIDVIQSQISKTVTTPKAK